MSKSSMHTKHVCYNQLRHDLKKPGEIFVANPGFGSKRQHTSVTHSIKQSTKRQTTRNHYIHRLEYITYKPKKETEAGNQMF